MSWLSNANCHVLTPMNRFFPRCFALKLLSLYQTHLILRIESMRSGGSMYNRLPKKESSTYGCKVEWIIEIWRKRQAFLKAGEETTNVLGRSARDLFCFCLSPLSTILRDGYYLLWKTIHFPWKKRRCKQNFDTCPSLSNMNYVVSKIVDHTSSSFLLVSAKDALSSNWFNTCVETLVFTHRPHYHSYHHHHPDIEFVTSGTSDTNIKYFWAWEIFSRINV